MNYYYILTEGNNERCIYKGTKHPLPRGTVFQCASDIDFVPPLKYLESISIPCNDGSKLSVDVKTDPVKSKNIVSIKELQKHPKKKTPKKVTKKTVRKSAVKSKRKSR